MIPSKAIARRLHHLRDIGQTPVAIVRDPEFADWMRENHVSYWWSGQRSLFNLPLEIDAGSKGWAVRVISMIRRPVQELSSPKGPSLPQVEQRNSWTL